MKNCANCGREMKPCPARIDGVLDTFVGYYQCACSREAWLNDECREWGIGYEEYLEYLPTFPRTDARTSATDRRGI